MHYNVRVNRDKSFMKASCMLLQSHEAVSDSEWGLNRCCDHGLYMHHLQNGLVHKHD